MADSDKESVKPSTANEPLNKDAFDTLDTSEAQESASFFADEDEQKTVVDDTPAAENVATGANSLETQLADWKGKVVYLSAEIENMRKRYSRERAELVKMANEDVLKSLFPVYDNMSYALRAAKDAERASGEAVPVVVKLIQGVEMTLKHFEQTLEQLGVTVIPSVGQNFDPASHEAVGQSELPEYGNDVVSSEVSKGFKLYNRVLRPARVLVNKK